MHIVPAPRTPVGEVTDADKIRAADWLSAERQRDIHPGSYAVYCLALQYAQARLEGYEQAQREAQQVAS